MGKANGRPQWILVVMLLGGALIMTIALLFPSVFRSDERLDRHLEFAGDLGPGASRNETATDVVAEEKQAATGPEKEKKEPLPPYGDHDLPHSEAIRGRVVDTEEKPVADAIVVAVYKDWRARPYRIVTASRVRSEEDGYFILGPLERQSYYVMAIKEGAGVGYAQGQMPGAWVDLVLAPGARLSGTVTVRASAEPVAGAKIVVSDWTFYAEGLTDAEGKYLLALLPVSSNTWSGYQVIVIADGFKRAQRTNLLVKHDQEHKVDFSLVPGATLSGNVVNAQSLQPVAGAEVGEGWEPYHRSVKTKEDGSYELANVATAPNFNFTVRAEGFLPQQQQSDGTGTLDFELDKSLVVAGTVKDRLDNPVVGARVYLHRIKNAPGFTWSRGRNAQTRTTTDASGKFRFPDVLPGQVAVVAFHREHAPGEYGPIKIPEGGPVPEGTDITLKEGLTVTGEVRDLQDNPLPSIRVQLQRSGWGKIQGYKWAHSYRWSENPIWYTDDKGKFELRGAMAGKHWLSAYDQTYGWAGTRIEGQEGQRITDVIISFAGATITGLFVNAANEPLPGAWVYATGPKNTPQKMSRWTQTDGLGRFKLGGLKEGSYDINGSTTFGRPEMLKDIPAGTQGVELKLKPTQVLRGQVTSIFTGRALERFYLQIQGQRKARSRRLPGYVRPTSWSGWLESPDGRFERPVTPGKYNLTFKAPGHAPKVLKDVIVEEHIPPQPKYVMLDGGGGIQGTVRGIDGKPLKNTYIYARVYRAPGEQQQPTDRAMGGYDHSDSKGRYFVQGLAPGTYLIQLNMGRRGAATAQVSVAGIEMVRQDLQLLPTGTVVLRVADEEGKPIQGVYFYFRDDNNNWVGWAGQSNKQGVSTSQPLRMGPVNVQAVHAQGKYTVDNFRLTVESSKTVTVDVVMQKKQK